MCSGAVVFASSCCYQRCVCYWMAMLLCRTSVVSLMAALPYLRRIARIKSVRALFMLQNQVRVADALPEDIQQSLEDLIDDESLAPHQVTDAPVQHTTPLDSGKQPPQTLRATPWQRAAGPCGGPLVNFIGSPATRRRRNILSRPDAPSSHRDFPLSVLRSPAKQGKWGISQFRVNVVSRCMHTITH